MPKIIRKYKGIIFEEDIVVASMTFEGLDFEEAVLSYKKRQKLSAGTFCGPNKSYPVNDAAHARNALARLSQFGGRLKPSVRKRVLACIKKKAKKFGVEVSETVPEGVLDWFLKNKETKEVEKDGIQ